MKRAKRIVILLCVLAFLAENIVFLFIVIHYRRTEPFADMILRMDKITYSSGSHETEKDLKERDIADLRGSLREINFYGPCIKRHFRANKEALHIYTNEGEIHTIVFEGYVGMLGYTVGVVEYDGEEYFCDEWLVRHYKDITKAFKNGN